MRLIIQSPAGIQVESGNVQSVRTTLKDGKPLTILSRHAPLMGEIGHTQIKVRSEGRDQTFAVKSGILLVQDEIVKILTQGMQEDADD